jgi:hypothetical protein
MLLLLLTLLRREKSWEFFDSLPACSFSNRRDIQLIEKFIQSGCSFLRQGRGNNSLPLPKWRSHLHEAGNLNPQR